MSHRFPNWFRAANTAARPHALPLADQFISSATNLLTALVALRALDANEFGVFALGSSVFALALGLARASAFEPLLLRGPGRSIDPSLIRSTTWAIGAISTVTLIVLTLALSWPTRVAWFWAAMSLPILVQDYCRYRCLASTEVKRTVVSDGLWFSWSLGVLVATGPLGEHAILALAPGPFIALAPFGSLLTRRRDDDGSPRERPAPDLWFGLEHNVALLAGVASGWALAGVLSTATYGTFRAALLFFQPLVSLQTGLRVLYLRSDQLRRSGRWPTVATVLGAVYSIPAVAVLVFASGRFDALDSNDLHAAAYGALIASEVSRARLQGVSDLVRGRSDASGLVRARIISAPALMIGVPALAAAFGLVGAFSARLGTHCLTLALMSAGRAREPSEASNGDTPGAVG